MLKSQDLVHIWFKVSSNKTHSKILLKTRSTLDSIPMRGDSPKMSRRVWLLDQVSTIKVAEIRKSPLRAVCLDQLKEDLPKALRRLIYQVLGSTTPILKVGTILLVKLLKFRMPRIRCASLIPCRFRKVSQFINRCIRSSKHSPTSSKTKRQSDKLPRTTKIKSNMIIRLIRLPTTSKRWAVETTPSFLLSSQDQRVKLVLDQSHLDMKTGKN